MRSIRLYLFAVALATTVLTAVSVTTILYLLDIAPSRAMYSQVIAQVLIHWQQDAPAIGEGWGDNPQGYIIAPAGVILYAVGDTACQEGELISRCLTDIAAIPVEGWRTMRAGVVWYEYQVPLRDGLRLLARVQPYSIWGYLSDFYRSNARIYPIALAAALPIAVLLALITVRPLAQRLQRIAETSRRFAAGHLNARTGEGAADEIGQLGQHFDQMAATIGSQMQELRTLAEQNSALSLALEQHARAAERATLSRDLHDAVSQHLFSLAMGTTNLAALIQRDPVQAEQQAEQLAAIATQAQDELRNVLQRLRPGGRGGRGLVESLTDLGQEWQKRYSIPVESRLELATIPLPALIEDILYRVCQEGLNNVARHAAARRVWLTLTQDNGAVLLTLTDNGRGFALAEARSGFGLLGMQERVRAVGGELSLASAPDQGTTLRVRLPVNHRLGQKE